jgi:hypothetical protein
LRIVIYSLFAVPLLILDAVLLYTLPGFLVGRFTAWQGGAMICGMAAYIAMHFLVRKPERLYLWGHELTHLIVAKIFLRQVHGFHITSRAGGKVVIDRTNVAIDLAPYAVPIYNLAAIVPVLLFGGNYQYAREIYIAVAAFLLTMHIAFSLEGFLHGQPDLRRSGRLFSGAAIVLCLLFWLPVLWAPGTRSDYHGISFFYREWLGSAVSAMHDLLPRIVRKILP